MDLLELTTEKELDAAIAQLCGLLRIERFHVYDSRRSMPGFPDLVLWRPDCADRWNGCRASHLMFRELKSANGRCSREQLAVMRGLANAGQNVAIWRPEDWRSGRIERELRLL